MKGDNLLDMDQMAQSILTAKVHGVLQCLIARGTVTGYFEPLVRKLTLSETSLLAVNSFMHTLNREFASIKVSASLTQELLDSESYLGIMLAMEGISCIREYGIALCRPYIGKHCQLPTVCAV